MPVEASLESLPASQSTDRLSSGDRMPGSGRSSQDYSQPLVCTAPVDRSPTHLSPVWWNLPPQLQWLRCLSGLALACAGLAKREWRKPKPQYP
ncbi:hypothetical protein U1Q18_015632 [Sarracenia purpurea var. burkii]